MQMNFEQARTKMVDNQIRPNDVTDHAILSAFLSVPREEFVDENKRDLAYLDRDHRISSGQRYMLNPAMLAKLVQLAGVEQDDVILQIGAGTGYTPALLSVLASSVVAIEEEEELAGQANENLTRLGYANVAVLQGPFAEGCAREAPFDVIFVDAGLEIVPHAWFDQLAEGGRLIAVLGHGNAARAMIYTKRSGLVGAVSEFNCAAPVLPGFEKDVEFAL